ncbi:hypothetical protein [Micromonospora sp. NPDC085948]|uniref:hypothetical protein n=1 Tax=Micromonospora sp. NPDC085948 TaxID=3155293 RepID=UPI003433DCFF
MPRHPEAIIEPNALLIDARRSRPSPNRRGQQMSRTELADAVNSSLDKLHPGRDMTAQYVDFRWIGKLERGEHRWPSVERRAALREVLATSEDARLGLYSPRRSPAVASSHPGSQIAPTAPLARLSLGLEDSLTADQLDAIEVWLHELQCLTQQTSPHVTPELGIQVRRHLDILDELQRGGRRPHLASVDARWSEFMSWIADNTGATDGGSWLERSRRRAGEADDQLLGAYILMRQSQRALDEGAVRTAISLSRQSLAYGPVPPRTRALCLTRMAEALATNGDEDTDGVIAAARRGLQRAANDAEDEFASHCDLRYVAAIDARCRQLIGDPVSAAAIFNELLEADHMVPLLDAGIWNAHLGECYLPNDPERAADHGMRALRLASETGSYRAIRASQPLAVALRRHTTLAPVRAFVDAHRAAVLGR